MNYSGNIFAPEIILWCLRWYSSTSLSYNTSPRYDSWVRDFR